MPYLFSHSYKLGLESWRNSDIRTTSISSKPVDTIKLYFHRDI